MRKEGEPPAPVVVDLQVARLAKAIVRRGEIAFELYVPERESASYLAEELRRVVFHGPRAFAPTKACPISVHEDRHDRSKLTVLYKSHGRRELDDDRRRLISMLDEVHIPFTIVVADGMRQAFDVLEALGAPEHGSAVAAEASRRSARKGPPGRGSG